MKLPTLSVIIPTHLRPKLLERALTSINNQSLREAIEVIVISDVKDSVTSGVCHKLLKSNDVYIIRNGISGPSDSRNIGLMIAKGKLIMFLDDDDSWSNNFTTELSPFLNNIGSDIVYFDCNVIKESRTAEGPQTQSEIAHKWANVDNNIYVKNQIHMSCLLFPKFTIENILFDSSMRAYEDWDFILSARNICTFNHLPLTCSNVHEVDDETTDRRGSSENAINFNAVLDYLYVYRRHPSPNSEIASRRHQLLSSTGLTLPIEIF